MKLRRKQFGTESLDGSGMYHDSECVLGGWCNSLDSRLGKWGINPNITK